MGAGYLHTAGQNARQKGSFMNQPTTKAKTNPGSIFDPVIQELEKLRKERVTNKRENIKEKTVHSFTLDLDIEMLLLKHFENTGAWRLSRLEEFVKRVFYRGLYDLAMKEGDKEYSHFVQMVSIGTLTETWIKNHSEQLRKKEAARAASGAEGQNETTWTGYFRGIEKAGNVLFPVWG